MMTWAQEAAEIAAAAGDVQAHRWLGYQQGKREASADREAEILALAGALRTIRQWDMLTPGKDQRDAFADAAWLRKVIDDVLGPTSGPPK